MNKQSNMFNPVRSNPHHKILLLGRNETIISGQQPNFNDDVPG